VTCRGHRRDRHNRLVGICETGGREVNREMVEAGFALAYNNYMREEAKARAAQRGLWAGEFERPRDWRRKNVLGH
jgi:endonuclease YncB( thermonuclease family)